METPGPNASETLCQAILAEARRQCETILRQARQETDALIEKAAADAEAARQASVGQARTEAARRTELILATVPVEAGRMRSARIESLLQSVFEEARRRLLTRAGFDYRETVIGLAAEAVGRMSGDRFVVKLSAEDRAALGADLAEAIARRVGHSPLIITLSDDPLITEGGLTVQDAEGRQVWDNRLPARLDRLWPELRRQAAVGAKFVMEQP